ncbi:MAG: GNAT family N-acetyltransferase [Verrucomicrobia bacterium]|nr:GNAT family N-acetyltransferase [Verrucomicrobiota bacterium]
MVDKHRRDLYQRFCERLGPDEHDDILSEIGRLQGSSMRVSLEEILTYRRDYGAIRLVKAFSQHFLYRNETRIIASVPTTSPGPDERCSEDIRIRSADLKDLEPLHELLLGSEGRVSITRVRERLSSGCSYVVALHEGRIVGYAVASPFELLRDRMLTRAIFKAVQISASDRLVANAFIHPSYRGKRVFPSLHRSLQELVSRTGVRRLLSVFKKDNQASRASHRRIGYQEICEVRLWRLLFLERTWESARLEGQWPRGPVE